MKKYEKPNMEIAAFEIEDIIQTSGGLNSEESGQPSIVDPYDSDLSVASML